MPFDLEHGPLLRVGLIRLTEEEAVLLVTMHHIVSDGWSIEVFFRELRDVYAAFLNNKASPLSTLAVQYADFAVWQRNWLSGDVLASQLAYWKAQLAGLPALELRGDRLRPAISSYNGGREFIDIDSHLAQSLKELSQSQNVTMFMTLLAAFQTLLFRYSEQRDIAVGTLTAGRNQKDTEPLIGFFVNTLVLRTNLSGSPTFKELLARVRDTALNAYAHPDLPFEKLVEELQPERDLSRNPLVQATFQFLNLAAASQDTEGDHRQLDADRGVATFDLSLDMWALGDRLRGRMEYSTDLFEASTVRRMVEHFSTLLHSVVDNPDQSIEALRLMSAAEFRRLTVEWNDTVRPYPRQRCAHELFEARASRTPEGIAVIDGGRQVTYAELDRRASHIAHWLCGLNMQAGAIVGLCVERSVDMIAGMLGILKCGAAFMPLDPQYPEERLAYMLGESQACAVVASAASASAIARSANLTLNLGDMPASMIGSPLRRASAGDLAYVMFTSGSTGPPKGVLIEHSSLLNHTLGVIERFGLTDGDRVLQFAAVGFDVAIEEIVPALVIGATVVVRPDCIVPTLRDLVAFMEMSQITVANLPAPYWHEWVDALEAGCTIPPSLRLLVIGSDRVDPVRVECWLDHGPIRPVLINAYGTTECTITSLTYEIEPSRSEANAAVPVGRPLANVTAYILDSSMQPVPIGVAGELYVGGAGVARGYLKEDSKRFIMCPLAATRLYRTGDRAYFAPNGNIVIIGRGDRQIKIRGFRVEPAEVEMLLERYEGVRNAVVTSDGGSRLIAYIATSASIDPGHIVQFLRARVPEYMVPSSIVVMERLPLTAQGKFDVRVLPPPGRIEQIAGTDSIGSPTAAETKLVQIWQEVLGIERIGMNDNFFDLGGHSLMLLRVHGKLEVAFQRDISIVDLFRYPSIRSLAHFLDQDAEAKPAAGSGKPRAQAQRSARRNGNARHLSP